MVGHAWVLRGAARQHAASRQVISDVIFLRAVGEAGDAAQIKLLERARDAALEEVASSQLVVGELKERMQVLEKEVSMAGERS